MKSKMSLLAAVFAATLFSSNASAQTVLFESDSTETCYRIPAIVNAKDGSVFAFSDFRPCRADVGAASSTWWQSAVRTTARLGARSILS